MVSGRTRHRSVILVCGGLGSNNLIFGIGRYVIICYCKVSLVRIRPWRRDIEGEYLRFDGDSGGLDRHQLTATLVIADGRPMALIGLGGGKRLR